MSTTTNSTVTDLDAARARRDKAAQTRKERADRLSPFAGAWVAFHETKGRVIVLRTMRGGDSTVAVLDANAYVSTVLESELTPAGSDAPNPIILKVAQNEHTKNPHDDATAFEMTALFMRAVERWTNRGRTCRACGLHKPITRFALITPDRRRHVCDDCR